MAKCVRSTGKCYVSTKLSHFLALFSNCTFPKEYFKNDFGLNKGFLDYSVCGYTLKKPAFLRGTLRNLDKRRIF